MGFLCRIVVVLLQLSLRQSPSIVLMRSSQIWIRKFHHYCCNIKFLRLLLLLFITAVIVSRSFGVADLQNGNAPSDTTLYNVASISKLVTAWGVMSLVEDGRIKLDDPISKHVSKWKLPQSDWNDDVTIRRLLTHTADSQCQAFPGISRTSRFHHFRKCYPILIPFAFWKSQAALIDIQAEDLQFFNF